PYGVAAGGVSLFGGTQGWAGRRSRDGAGGLHLRTADPRQYLVSHQPSGSRRFGNTYPGIDRGAGPVQRRRGPPRFSGTPEPVDPGRDRLRGATPNLQPAPDRHRPGVLTGDDGRHHLGIAPGGEPTAQPTGRVGLVHWLTSNLRPGCWVGGLSHR